MISNTHLLMYFLRPILNVSKIAHLLPKFFKVKQEKLVAYSKSFGYTNNCEEAIA